MESKDNMAITYDKIATTTLGSTSATITFSSIAATYTDLRLVLVGTNTAALNINSTFNGDTGSNYSLTTLSGDGATVTGADSLTQTSIRVNNTSMAVSQPYFITMDIFSYAGSTLKTCLVTASEDKNGSGTTGIRVGIWASTSAITSITFTTSTSTFAVGTTATLYGILKA